MNGGDVFLFGGYSIKGPFNGIRVLLNNKKFEIIGIK
jgi:hypothetical protein